MAEKKDDGTEDKAFKECLKKGKYYSEDIVEDIIALFSVEEEQEPRDAHFEHKEIVQRLENLELATIEEEEVVVQHEDNPDTAKSATTGEETKQENLDEGAAAWPLEPNKIHCDKCPLAFTTPEDLNRHSRVHKQCRCPKCKERYLLAEEQDDDDDYIEYGIGITCENCVKYFKTENEYRAHTCCLYRRYQGSFFEEPPIMFECQRCEGLFSSFDQYRTHNCSPDGEKKSKPKCSFCTFNFKMRQEIINHVIDNHGKCPHCFRKFLSKDLILKHILEDHHQHDNFF